MKFYQLKVAHSQQTLQTNVQIVELRRLHYGEEIWRELIYAMHAVYERVYTDMRDKHVGYRTT